MTNLIISRRSPDDVVAYLGPLPGPPQLGCPLLVHRIVPLTFLPCWYTVSAIAARSCSAHFTPVQLLQKWRSADSSTVLMPAARREQKVHMARTMEPPWPAHDSPSPSSFMRTCCLAPPSSLHTHPGKGPLLLTSFNYIKLHYTRGMADPFLECYSGSWWSDFCLEMAKKLSSSSKSNFESVNYKCEVLTHDHSLSKGSVKRFFIPSCD